MEDVMTEAGSRSRAPERVAGGRRFGRSEAEHREGRPLEGRGSGAGSSPFRPLKQPARPGCLMSLAGGGQGPSTETWIPAHLQF